MCAAQEVDVLKSVSYDRNVVQFYGTCPHGDQTMLVLEYMEVAALHIHVLTYSALLSIAKSSGMLSKFFASVEVCWCM